jgi:hypothetical protein
MADRDLLRELFVQEGLKKGLDEEMLDEVLSVLIRDQFIPKGKRNFVQSDLNNLIKKYVKGD